MNICKTDEIVEYDDVARIATMLVRRGIKPTMMLVRNKLGGGNLRDIAPLLKRWNEEHEKERKVPMTVCAHGKTAKDYLDELEQQLVAIQSKFAAVEKIWSEMDALRMENRELAVGKAMAEIMVDSLRGQLAKAETQEKQIASK